MKDYHSKSVYRRPAPLRGFLAALAVAFWLPILFNFVVNLIGV